ncbi:tRNA-binding protein [Flavobacteriaceae bacterium MAR_2009_75]|nr:tRNA-binding protein [Flavobacteriaceae bacterium MAR_2009_75]
MQAEISWSDFAKIDMRVGTIIEVNDFPKARNPAYQIHVDFGGELGIRKSSAQITSRYSREELVGKQVIAVVNFPKKQIANFMSECLILGAVNGKDVTLLQPQAEVENGLKIS